MIRTLAVASAAFASLAAAFEGTTDTYAASALNKTYSDLTATWYYPATGSCGWTNTSTQYVASILPPEGATNFTEFCGRTINVTNLDNGKTVLATVVDECTGCRSSGFSHFLNLSPAVFKNVSTLDTGVFNAKWHVVDADVPYVEPETAAADPYAKYSGEDSGYTATPTWTKVVKPASSSSSAPAWSSTPQAEVKVAAAAPSSSSWSETSSEWQAPSSSSSQWQAPSSSSSWTPEPSPSSSSSWSSSSWSSSSQWTPSSSSSSPEWTSSSSSSTWSSSTPAWTPSSSSTWSSSTPAWTPSSSSSQWTPSSSSTPQPQATPKAAWSGGDSYSGHATFFYQGGNPGNCGNYNSDSTPLVALDSRMYSGGSHCGQYVYITRTDNGKSVQAIVADMCPGCSSSGSLDLSTGAFNQIASPSEGMVPITWHFV